METAIIRFTTKWPPDFTSPIIAMLGGSRKFSHVMLIVRGLAYEATMMHGVRVLSVDDAMMGVAYYQDMEIEIPDIESAIEFGELQHGKGYDYMGAFGIPFMASTDWCDWSKWWCSELVFAQLGAGGLWLLDPEEQKRVTPNDLRQCNYRKSLIVKV